MFWLDFTSTIIRGSISEEDLNALPETIKLRLSECGSGGRVDSDGCVTFIFHDITSAKACSDDIRRYEKNRIRSERRRFSEFMCTGLYEKSDIEYIYAAQDGKCYYTGEPLDRLLRRDKNWSIDHIMPVHLGGSFWPGNIALALKEVNKEKHGSTKATYWKMLEDRHGHSWAAERKEQCKAIDVIRRKIDRERKNAVQRMLSAIEEDMRQIFLNSDIRLFLDGKALVLEASSIEVRYPGGFLRRREIFKDAGYFVNVARAILAGCHISMDGS